MIDSNGVTQFTKKRKPIKNMKLMPKITWELFSLINAENVELCVLLEHITVVPARDASTEWITIAHGLTTVSDI